MKIASVETSHEPVGGAKSGLHIAFGVDTHYVPAMAATIASIIQHNPTLKLAFHILATDFSQDDRERLGVLARQNNLIFRVHDTDHVKLAGLPEPGALTRATYNRLLIGDVLGDITDKVLYLDADITCLGSLSELVSLDLGGKTVAAVADAEQDKRKADAGLKGEEPYFNAGVLYIDLKRWNAGGVTAATLKLLQEKRDRFPMLDQDALNAVLKGQVLFLDRKWNLLIDNCPVQDDTVFLHYAGCKPWQQWSRNFQDSHFTAALARTPWADWRYVPTTRKHRNKQAQYFLANGNVMRGLYWYMLFMLTAKKVKKNKKPAVRSSASASY